MFPSGQTLKRVAWLLLGVVVLPHELAHAAVLRPWSSDLTLDLDPNADPRFRTTGQARPLARFDATVPASTPTWVIRASAIAPLPSFLLLAVLLDTTFGFAGVSPVTIGVTAAVAVWASVSDGDVAVFMSPETVVRRGEFVVSVDSNVPSAVATALTLAATAVVALLFFT